MGKQYRDFPRLGLTLSADCKSWVWRDFRGQAPKVKWPRYIKMMLLVIAAPEPQPRTGRNTIGLQKKKRTVQSNKREAKS